MSDKTKETRCPHCNGLVKISVSTEIRLVEPSADAKNSLAGFKEEDLQIIIMIQDSGIFEVFEEVLREVKKDHMPNNVPAFFLSFIRKAIPRIIPKWALDTFVKETNAHIDFRATEGIGVVLADGFIHRFVAADSVLGKQIRSSSGKSKAKIGANQNRFEVWTKTRFGYVLADSRIFLDQLLATPHGKLPRGDYK